jgi:2-amino-4-hydroxy-6-hydroxymethyldihydropteridine diphosphokinase
MILIGLGANLSSPDYGSPVRTLSAALRQLDGEGVSVLALSRWYESAPVPCSTQPWYVNAVARIESALEPGALLDLLHAAEARFGRVRGEVNGPRLIDLDLLDYHGLIRATWPVLPHPRLSERAFVLAPLLDVAPDWRHPASGRMAAELFAEIGPGQQIRAFEPGPD